MKSPVNCSVRPATDAHRSSLTRQHRHAVRRLAALAVVATLASTSHTALAQDIEIIEPGAQSTDVMRYPPSKVRPGLIAGGLGLTATAYGISAAVAATAGEFPGQESLYIPVAGPWIALGQSGCSDGETDCTSDLVLRSVLLVLSGLGQLGGLGIAAEGIFMTTEADAPPNEARKAAPVSNVRLTPLAVRNNAPSWAKAAERPVVGSALTLRF